MPNHKLGKTEEKIQPAMHAFILQVSLHRRPSHRSRPHDLSITRSTRSLLILPQTHQQLSKLCLITTSRTSSRPLATQIHQLGNALPARTTSRRVLPILQELLSITSSLCNGLLLLRIVVLVEVVDVLLGRLDCLVLLLLRAGFPVLELQVAALTPLLDNFGLFFVVGAGGVVAGLEGDGAAWCYTLIIQMKSAICVIFLVLIRRPRLLSRIEPEYIDN